MRRFGLCILVVVIFVATILFDPLELSKPASAENGTLRWHHMYSSNLPEMVNSNDKLSVSATSAGDTRQAVTLSPIESEWQLHTTSLPAIDTSSPESQATNLTDEVPICQAINGSAASWSSYHGEDGSEMHAWTSNGCRLHVYSKNDLRKCFITSKLYFVGDSTLRWVVDLLYQQSGSDVRLGKIPGYTVVDVFKWSDIPNVFQVEPEFWTESIPNGTVGLLLNMAAWNVGGSWSGATNYHNRLLGHLIAIRKILGPAGLPFVAQLHTLNPEVAEKTAACLPQLNTCKVCNSHPRQWLFREMIRNAAACAGVQLFDTTHMTQSDFAKANIADPVHYNTPIRQAKALQIANHFCKRPDGSRLAGADPGTCHQNVDYDAMMEASQQCKCCVQPCEAASDVLRRNEVSAFLASTVCNASLRAR